MLRKIVKIDQEKCDGCGLCVPSCAEGAITIVNGKAVLAADNLCDGLGACLGECPQDAITVEEREADAFDEAAVEQHLAAQGKPASVHHQPAPAAPAPHHHGGGGCPGSRAMSFARPQQAPADQPAGSRQSQLAQWPVQLHLVPTTAPYFQGADLLITADCVPVAYAGYHEDFLKGKAVVMGCPKLDDNNFYVQKLTELFTKSDIKSITVLKMEVPCCGGIAMAARQALAASGKQIPYNEVTIGIQGAIKG
ncbi:ATP-binding protein [Geobacter sp. SVR]|uniref:ATP-binding protein n=1 Tax=Geobacter sp. SVR TaxID=2495594 RepID=UPI00143EF838|nr:4Fe-4S binding protein [Geobacter sp. SVR]BCS56068.1 4Fe-4S ferredoxin [Geobacter sp. SVR]GCF84831.1 4Fe-4S ferredoxin [Geobacter sp. SVR]